MLGYHKNPPACASTTANGFANPLRRKEVRVPSPLSPIYKDVLDYTRVPVLDTIPVHIHVSAQHTGRLQRLVREAHASMGSGIYGTVAMCMMEMYERREPGIKAQDRECSIIGFPLSPRLFFGFSSNPDGHDARLLRWHRTALLVVATEYRRKTQTSCTTNHAGDVVRTQFLTSRGAGFVLANQ